MLDVFAFLLPLIMMVLWFAIQGQTKKKQIDPSGGDISGVTINFKYTTSNIVHFPSSPATTSITENISFSTKCTNWILRQDYILLFLVPLNLLTLIFFGIAYPLRSLREDAVSQFGYILTFCFYAALVWMALVVLRTCKRNEESSMIVTVLTTLRALGALAPLVLAEGYELLITQTVLDTWGNFLTIHLLTVLAREYFEDKFMKQDIEKALASEPPSDKTPTELDDLTIDESNLPAVQSILTRENVFITAVLACSLATTILVVVPDWHNKQLVIAGFECSIWLSLILECMVTLFVIFHVAPMVRGKSVGNVRARWVVLIVIIGGIILRILFDAGANINELSLGSYVPFVTTRAFLNFWKENFTQAIPLAFHLLLANDKATDNEGKPEIVKPRDALTIMKQIFCAYLLSLHIMAVGLLLETTSYSFGYTAACVGALIATTDFSLVLCKFVPVIAQHVHKDV